MATWARPLRPLKVLVVEDNPAEAELLLECRSNGSVQWTVVKDGFEALNHLRADPRAADLVILDLNLPGLEGHEVLTDIRADAQLRTLPVIVFSHSAAQRDIARAYAEGANCYVTKPTNFDELERTVSLLETFWLGVVSLPPR